MKAFLSKIVRVYRQYQADLKAREPKPKKEKPPKLKVRREPKPKGGKARYQEVEVSRSVVDPKADGEEHLLVRIHRSQALRNSVQLLTSGGLLAFLAPLLQSETGLQVWITVLAVAAFLFLVFFISVWTSSKVHSSWLSSSPYLLVVFAVGILAVKPFSPLTPRIYVVRTGESFSFFDPQRYISHTGFVSADAKLIAANHPAHGWIAAALRDINGGSEEKGGWYAAARWLPDSLKRRMKTEIVFLDKTQRGPFSVIPIRVPEEKLSYESDLTGAGYKAYDFEIGAAMRTKISLGLKPVTRMKNGDTRLGVDFSIRSENNEENIEFDMTNRLEAAQWEDFILYSDFDNRSALYSAYLSEFFLAADMKEAWAIYQPKLWETVPNDRERVRLLLLSIRLNNVSASGILLQSQSLPDLRRLDAIWSGKSISASMLAEDQFLFWAAQEFIEVSEPFCGIVTPETVSTSTSTSSSDGNGNSTTRSSWSSKTTVKAPGVEPESGEDLGLFSNRFRERRRALEEAMLAVRNANAPVNLVEEKTGSMVARYYATSTTDKLREKYPISMIREVLKFFWEISSEIRQNPAAAWLKVAGWEDLKHSLEEDPETEFLFSREAGGSRLGRGGRLGPDAESDIFVGALHGEYFRRVALAVEDDFVDEFNKEEPDLVSCASKLLGAMLGQGELFDDFAAHADQIRAKGFDVELGPEFDFLRLASAEYQASRSSPAKVEIPPLVTELLSFVSSPSAKKLMERFELVEGFRSDDPENTLGELEKHNPELLGQITALARAAEKYSPDRAVVDLWRKRFEAMLEIAGSPSLAKLIEEEILDPVEISETLLSTVRESSLVQEDKDVVTGFLRLEKALRCYLSWKEMSDHRNQLGSRLPGLIDAAKSTRDVISTFDSTFLEDMIELAADRPRSPLWTFMLRQIDLDENSPDVRKALEEALAKEGRSKRLLSASDQRLKALIDRLMMVMMQSEERSIAVNRATGKVEFDPPFPALEEWIRTVSMAQGSEAEGGGFPFTADALVLDLILRTMKDETIVGYEETNLGLPRKIFEKVAGQTVESYIDDALGDLQTPQPPLVEGSNPEPTTLPVSKITIEGNTKTHLSFIMRELGVAGIREGVVFDFEALRSAVSELRSTMFFADVSARTFPNTGRDGIEVEIRIEEQATGSVGLKSGYSSIDGAKILLELAQPNFDAFNFPDFTGKGISFATTIDINPEHQSLEVKLGSRNFFGNPLILTLPSRGEPPAIEVPVTVPAPAEKQGSKGK